MKFRTVKLIVTILKEYDLTSGVVNSPTTKPVAQFKNAQFYTGDSSLSYVICIYTHR